MGDEQKKPVIEVDDLYKIYRVGDERVRALNGVSFKIYEGEVYGLLGINGAGKTTLIKMIFVLQQIDRGSIYVLGKER